jgi:hypothetical protein
MLILLISFFYTIPLVCDLLIVWPVFHNIAVLLLGVYFTSERNHPASGLLSLGTVT